MKKDIMSVKDVIVMETAASLNVAAILSGTGLEMLVLLQAANMTKVSSIPIPAMKKYYLHYHYCIFIYSNLAITLNAININT